ncbi:hypothetical protein KCV06_g305, partial [Aureobasidium melanogenum]
LRWPFKGLGCIQEIRATRRLKYLSIPKYQDKATKCLPALHGTRRLSPCPSSMMVVVSQGSSVNIEFMANDILRNWNSDEDFSRLQEDFGSGDRRIAGTQLLLFSSDARAVRVIAICQSRQYRNEMWRSATDTRFAWRWPPPWLWMLECSLVLLPSSTGSHKKETLHTVCKERHLAPEYGTRRMVLFVMPDPSSRSNRGRWEEKATSFCGVPLELVNKHKQDGATCTYQHPFPPSLHLRKVSSTNRLSVKLWWLCKCGNMEEMSDA